MKKRTWFLLLLIPALLVSLAVARPAYRIQAINQLHLVPDKDSTRTITCQYCHVNPGGGAPWNPFGENVLSNFKSTIDQALYDALAAMKDSDADGYLDVLEVFAGTLPGSPDSKPLVDAEFLKKNFEKAGGLGLYKPAN